MKMIYLIHKKIHIYIKKQLQGDIYSYMIKILE